MPIKMKFTTLIKATNIRMKKIRELY